VSTSNLPAIRSSSGAAALDGMQTILRTLSVERDPQRLCKQAVEEAATFFGVSECVVLLYDAASGTYRAQRPGVGLDEAGLLRLSSIPCDHIQRLLASWPDHGVLRLLTDQYLTAAEATQSGGPAERPVLLALLRADDQTTGILRLADRQDGHAFSEEEIHLLGLLANQLGLLVHLYSEQATAALEYARLFQQTQHHLRIAEQRSHELAMVNRISSNLSASLDLSAVLMNTVTELAQALDVEQAGLVLFDWTKGYGILKAEYQRHPDETGHDTRIPLAGNLSIARVLKTRQPLVIRDAQHDPLLDNAHTVMEKRGVKSILLLPVIVRGEVIGTVGLDELQQERDFTPSQIELAQTITNQAASAIANAQLYEDANRRAGQLQTIQGVMSRIGSILDLDELLGQVADLIAERGGYAHVHVLLMDEAGEYLVVKGGSGPIGRQLVADGWRLRVGQDGLCGWAAEAGEVVLANDVSTERRYLSCQQLAGIRSEIAVPMRLTGRVVGVLEVASNELDAFADADRFVIETLADQAAVVIQNARLYETAQEKARQLTAAYEDLRELDRMKDEFVQTVSHELRTPLTYVKGYVEILLEGMLGNLNGEQANALGIVRQRTESVVRLVNDIISLTRADSIELVLQPADLRQVALGAVEAALAVANGAGIELELEAPEGLLPVTGDLQRLGQVFDNLIGNAIKFSPDGGKIWVRLQTEDTSVRAEVVDQGIGIPADQLDRVWERFYQVDGTTTRRFGGTGLGLAIVKRLVEAHHGQVGVSSKPGRGSTFYFTIPRADV
jgi:signal transduction histidine kinase